MSIPRYCHVLSKTLRRFFYVAKCECLIKAKPGKSNSQEWQNHTFRLSKKTR
jgi:hypothetical protein